MRVLVKSANVIEEVISGGKSAGTILFKQVCLLDQGNDETLSFRVTIEKGKPYSPGLYDLAPSSFVVNRFRSLELDPYNVRLIPVEVPARKAA